MAKYRYDRTRYEVFNEEGQVVISYGSERPDEEVAADIREFDRQQHADDQQNNEDLPSTFDTETGEWS